MTPQQREALDSEAHRVVFGSSSARLRGEALDVTLLLAGYIDQAHAHGVSLSEAWAYLYGAAITELTDVIEDLAEEHHQSPAAELSDRALAFQMDPL